MGRACAESEAAGGYGCEGALDVVWGRRGRRKEFLVSDGGTVIDAAVAWDRVCAEPIRLFGCDGADADL